MRIDLLFGPSEYQTCSRDHWENTTCVVFDILRFTTSATCALAAGALGVLPARSIEHALELREQYPDALLAGERNGTKIGPSLTGGVLFDLGNSPREFTPEHVAGKLVISTTTNGTRALNYCHGAPRILAVSFHNMTATARWILCHPSPKLCLVCAGTHEENSYEDMLGAGALADQLLHALENRGEKSTYSDSVLACRYLYHGAEKIGLSNAFHTSRNGKNLASYSYLADDVPFSAQKDTRSFAILLDEAGILRKIAD